MKKNSHLNSTLPSGPSISPSSSETLSLALLFPSHSAMALWAAHTYTLSILRRHLVALSWIAGFCSSAKSTVSPTSFLFGYILAVKAYS